MLTCNFYLHGNLSIRLSLSRWKLFSTASVYVYFLFKQYYNYRQCFHRSIGEATRGCRMEGSTIPAEVTNLELELQQMFKFSKDIECRANRVSEEPSAKLGVFQFIRYVLISFIHKNKTS